MIKENVFVPIITTIKSNSYLVVTVKVKHALCWYSVCRLRDGTINGFLAVKGNVEILGRMRTPVREAISYGIQHISLWFNGVWPYASLNHNKICRIPYENASRTGYSTHPPYWSFKIKLLFVYFFVLNDRPKGTR